MHEIYFLKMDGLERESDDNKMMREQPRISDLVCFLLCFRTGMFYVCILPAAAAPRWEKHTDSAGNTKAFGGSDHYNSEELGQNEKKGS